MRAIPRTESDTRSSTLPINSGAADLDAVSVNLAPPSAIQPGSISNSAFIMLSVPPSGTSKRGLCPSP